MLVIFAFSPKIRTREPGPILGNMDLNRSLVGDPYSGTWTHTWEPGPVLGNLPYLFIYSEILVWVIDLAKKIPTFQKKCLKKYFSSFLVPYLVESYFDMSHGSYDSNLGSKRLILARDIKSRSWPNIGGTYGKF